MTPTRSMGRECRPTRMVWLTALSSRSMRVTTAYTKTSVDVLATYTFKVWAVSNVGSLTSTQADVQFGHARCSLRALRAGLTMSAAVVDLVKDYSHWLEALPQH